MKLFLWATICVVALFSASLAETELSSLFSDQFGDSNDLDNLEKEIIKLHPELAPARPIKVIKHEVYKLIIYFSSINF